MVDSLHTAASDVLAAAVVELRKRAGLNQRQLAAAVGREQNFVARVETRQRRLDLVEWVQICRACGVDPEREIGAILKRLVSAVPQRRRK